MSPQAEVVTARLRMTWLQWWTFSFWSGAILAVAVSLATLMLFVLVDALLKLPQRALVSLFAVWAVFSLAAIAALLVRQQRGRRSLAATARRVELAFPELESHLINLVQFAGRDGLEADPFRQAAIAQSAAAVAGFPFDQAATRENRWRRFLLCMQTPRDLFESFVLLALVLGLAVLCSAVVPAWGSSTRRILHPFTFVPSLGSVKIVKITPGDTDVLIGSSLQIAAEIDNPARQQLMATQDKIIVVLRRLMNEVRKDTADLLAEMKKRPGTELPSDVQSKLKDLKDKLDEFLKQQKKVIEATESLAKKPVEDFTEKDKQMLKELAATEDEWAKFMADKHTDLSKLPEQDFANPSLLKELVEVQTELKMAKDAMTKKTADIAVPLEQLGAEMAKEMTTNIEKWLPDTPDRERWSQEEPLTDDMKEAPMAELPKEMEDIVGKLMEDEEDLFNEMEDASSSWADSLDKGAGWDAMDGPISNNSARGVTGNRLPNGSEIAGRSGEGRQGKSSGEFVGDTAVGKGGRNTPSRLTPDAFVKGQVKDYSKDPVGGATGGGKESGVGGEGLHGPVPNRPERDMGRLATKQAQLRNKAEGVDLRFKVLKYHYNDLKRMIDVMAAVEGDLKAGRYRSALRRRDVLIEGLGEVKTYLKGEFTVRQDQTANLPTDIQKEILGSIQEPSPPGWEELNRQYFERLTTAPAAAAEQPAMATQPPNPPQAGKK